MAHVNNGHHPDLIGEVWGVRLFKDGTVIRPPTSGFPDIPADSDFVDGVASKDLILDSSKDIWVRLYLPEVASSQNRKVPIIVFLHGGGFTTWSPASSLFHDMCARISVELEVMVVSVNYRLAPEHKLPAAFDDAFFVLEWLQQQAKSGEDVDPWLQNNGEFSQCFLMGTSTGGLMAHQLGVKACTQDLSPVCVKGHILIVPSFGGEERTHSELNNEIRCEALNLQHVDAVWRLCLPEGINRDHPFCNPLGPNSPNLAKLELPPSFVVVGARDTYHDRATMYADALQEAGKIVIVMRYNSNAHVFPFPDDIACKELRNFIVRCLSKEHSGQEVSEKSYPVIVVP